MYIYNIDVYRQYTTWMGSSKMFRGFELERNKYTLHTYLHTRHTYYNY